MKTYLLLKDVYCDKCGKDTVLETIKENQPAKESVRKSMSEYSGQSNKLATHCLTCSNCRNYLEFTK